jgi:hypothetical protein
MFQVIDQNWIVLFTGTYTECTDFINISEGNLTIITGKSKMTFEQFMESVDFKIQMNDYLGEDFRAGQLFIMELFEVHPDIAVQLRGSMLDPTYKHRITEVVKNFVKDRW